MLAQHQIGSGFLLESIQQHVSFVFWNKNRKFRWVILILPLTAVTASSLASWANHHRSQHQTHTDGKRAAGFGTTNLHSPEIGPCYRGKLPSMWVFIVAVNKTSSLGYVFTAMTRYVIVNVSECIEKGRKHVCLGKCRVFSSKPS